VKAARGEGVEERLAALEVLVGETREAMYALGEAVYGDLKDVEEALNQELGRLVKVENQVGTAETGLANLGLAFMPVHERLEKVEQGVKDVKSVIDVLWEGR
jgi:hypothetical protein